MENSNEKDIFEEFFTSMKDDFEKHQEEFNKNFIKPNIVLSGKTGVGKSTLVNAIFNCDLADAGVGKPVSQSIIKYDLPNNPVVLFDTKGMEMDPLEREKSRTSILDEIKKRATSPEVKEHLHIMWYCISNQGDRIEDVEIDWIRDFSAYMPVIIVVTKSIDNENDLEKIIKLELPEIPVCRVLAKDRVLYGNYKIPAYGLKQLVYETLEILPEATQRAFTAAQKIDINEKVESAKKHVRERLDAKSPFGYKNLAHTTDALPIGIDIIGKSAVYLLIAKDVMTLMGISNNKNFLSFAKNARPIIKSIIIPFVFYEGGKTVSKLGSAKLSSRVIPYVEKLLGKAVTKGNFFLSPVIGLILGTFNRKVTEMIAYEFINVCKDFLEQNSNYKDLSQKQIFDILARNMTNKMKEKESAFEKMHEETLENQV